MSKPRKPRPPRKPRDFKAEYERRIVRALEKGKTRQAARGHRPHEHIERKEREREEQGVAGSELESIRRWYNRRFNPARIKETELEEIIDQARELGYEWFQNYRKTWNIARTRYLQELKDGSYESRGLPYLESLTNTAEAPDISWLYYH